MSLLMEAEKINFSSFKDKYTGNVTDLPTKYVTVIIDGAPKKVIDYYGSPLSLTVFENHIDQITHSVRWIGIGSDNNINFWAPGVDSLYILYDTIRSRRWRKIINDDSASDILSSIDRITDSLNFHYQDSIRRIVKTKYDKLSNEEIDSIEVLTPPYQGAWGIGLIK